MRVEQWPCNGSYNQNWAYVMNGAGRSLENEGMIVNTASGASILAASTTAVAWSSRMAIHRLHVAL